MRKNIFISAIILFILIGLAAPGYCDDPLRKLGRGICNVITCPFELVAQPASINNSDGPAAASTYGVLRGIGMTLMRGAVGVYEIATFPFPVPKNYAPILKDPEFFFEESIW